MRVRSVAALAGLVGGLAVACAELVGGDAVRSAGLVLLAVAALGAGAGLVSRSAPALRVLVAVCFALLAGSVLAVLVDAVGTPAYAVVGTTAAVICLVVMLVRRPEPAPSARRAPRRAGRGAHAR